MITIYTNVEQRFKNMINYFNSYSNIDDDNERIIDYVCIYDAQGNGIIFVSYDEIQLLKNERLEIRCKMDNNIYKRFIINCIEDKMNVNIEELVNEYREKYNSKNVSVLMAQLCDNKNDKKKMDITSIVNEYLLEENDEIPISHIMIKHNNAINSNKYKKKYNIIKVTNFSLSGLNTYDIDLYDDNSLMKLM